MFSGTPMPEQLTSVQWLRLVEESHTEMSLRLCLVRWYNRETERREFDEVWQAYRTRGSEGSKIKSCKILSSVKYYLKNSVLDEY